MWSCVFMFIFVLCSNEDVEDFDSVISSTEKLNHPTASRPRVMDRRPRSQIFTSVSLDTKHTHVCIIWVIFLLLSNPHVVLESDLFIKLEQHKGRLVFSHLSDAINWRHIFVTLQKLATRQIWLLYLLCVTITWACPALSVGDLWVV